MMMSAALLGLLVVTGGAIMLAAGLVVYLIANKRDSRVAHYFAFGLIGIGFLVLVSSALGLLALALFQ